MLEDVGTRDHCGERMSSYLILLMVYEIPTSYGLNWRLIGKCTMLRLSLLNQSLASALRVRISILLSHRVRCQSDHSYG